MWTRAELKSNCKEVMKRSYGKMFFACLISSFLYALITYVTEMNPDNFGEFLAIAMLVVIIANVFVYVPLDCGLKRFMLLNRVETQKVSEVFYFFSHNYFNVVKIILIRNIKIALWTLCFLIPGLVKAYEYQMIPYILAENPTISTKEAFARTKELTYGHKWNMLVLEFSFIGWLLLGSLLIIGVVFVNPYIEGTSAELYTKLKEIKDQTMDSIDVDAQETTI